MGKPNDEKEMGIIPRLCNHLFQRIHDNEDPNLQYSVEVRSSESNRLAKIFANFYS